MGSLLLLVVAIGHDHASQWSVVGTLDNLPNEVELSGGNLVFDVWNIIECAFDLGISNSLFLHTCHVDGVVHANVGKKTLKLLPFKSFLR